MMKGRKVVDLGNRRKESRQKNSGKNIEGKENGPAKVLKFSREGPMPSARGSPGITSSELLAFLEKEIGISVPKSLVDMISIPNFLFKVGNKSFSSEDSMAMRMILVAINQRDPLPRQLPGFGFSISSSNGSVFATLVDMRRKIFVHEVVNSLYGGASWDSFTRALENALAKTEEARKSSLPFNFVRTGSGYTKLI